MVAVKDETLTVRMPGELRGELERERQRMSRAAGAEVKTSSVVRAILERELQPKKKGKSSKARGGRSATT